MEACDCPSLPRMRQLALRAAPYADGPITLAHRRRNREGEEAGPWPPHFFE